MIFQKLIRKHLNGTFVEAGFASRGNSWHIALDEVWCVVNLQKSAYSELYFLNLGFQVTQTEPPDFTPPHRCDVSTRADRLLLAEGEQMSKLLDFSEGIEGAEMQISALTTLVAETLIPWLLSMNTIASLRELIRSNRAILVRKEHHETFGVEF